MEEKNEIKIESLSADSHISAKTTNDATGTVFTVITSGDKNVSIILNLPDNPARIIPAISPSKNPPTILTKV